MNQSGRIVKKETKVCHHQMKKIAVFASGNGSNFQVIAEQFPVEFVFSDHRDAYVLEQTSLCPTIFFELMGV